MTLHTISPYSTNRRSRRISSAALLSMVLSALILGGCAATGPQTYPATYTPAGNRMTQATAPEPVEAAASAPAASGVAAVPGEPTSPPSVATPASPSDEAPAPTPVPEDPLRPGVHVDLDDRSQQMDLWTRVRQGFAMPDLDNELVRDREQWYATRPDYVQRITERGGRYLFHIVEELDRRGMPTELALLPFIESAFNPQALSIAKASGMWQFMPLTGRDFDLKQNLFRDDRRDVLASTRAALDYLQKLHDMFGDWQLALAAYNWGEGSVQRAIARNEKAGLPTDYQSLKMPQETQYYVPKLQAVKNIIAHPEKFGLTLPELANHPYFLTVPIERDMDVAVAARLAGMPLDEFHSLNPQLNQPVILAAGTPQVLLPYDNANQFVKLLPMHRGPLASWTAWVAPKTMRPAEVAQQVGMTEAELRKVNKIPLRMLVKTGSTLIVPRGEHRQADVSEEIADNAMMAFAPDVPPLRKLVLKAGKKDSVASVAQRYRVSAAQVGQWNGLASNARFKPGQSVIVYIASAVPKGRTVRGPATAQARASKPAAATRATASAPKAARPNRTATAGRKAGGKPTRVAAGSRGESGAN